MYRLVIEQEAKTKRGKTKQFSGTLLGYITADMLWTGGAGESERPVYLALAGSEAALRPLVMNLRTGKKAFLEKIERHGWGSRKKTWFEILKSGGYELTWQRGQKVATATFFQTNLFQSDPGLLDPDVCQFVLLTPKWWAAEQHKQLTPDRVKPVLNHAKALGLNQSENELSTPAFGDDELLVMLPQAIRFCHYLDKRTRRPLLNDFAFSLQVYLAALSDGVGSFAHPGDDEQVPWGVASWAKGFQEFSADRMGFLPGVVVDIKHTELNIWLAAQVKLYRSVRSNHGAT